MIQIPLACQSTEQQHLFIPLSPEVKDQRRMASHVTCWVLTVWVPLFTNTNAPHRRHWYFSSVLHGQLIGNTSEKNEPEHGKDPKNQYCCTTLFERKAKKRLVNLLWSLWMNSSHVLEEQLDELASNSWSVMTSSICTKWARSRSERQGEQKSRIFTWSLQGH